MDRQVKRGKIGEAEKQAALKRISSGTGLEMFADSDIVIEAASENEEIKRAIFTTLCPQLKPAATATRESSAARPITKPRRRHKIGKAAGKERVGRSGEKQGEG